jgi:hypothetical protein
VEIENRPDWMTWELRTKYLPASFHKTKSMTYLGKLAKLNWEDMGLETALLVVLAMGLALRDLHAVNFQQNDGPDPEDMPTWVSGSPLKIEHIHKVLELWATQLEPVEYENGDGGGNGDLRSKRRTRSGAKGSDKGKGKGRDKGEDDGSAEDEPP